jgi:hypothetical protein
MQINTIGEALFWSYANLAMAHAAVGSGSTKYGPKHFMIRAKLYHGLRKGTMNVGSILDDERLKMILPQACCYCGSKDRLAVDHLISKKKGGQDSGDNIVWACRTCNSSKGSKDVLTWFSQRAEFPPLLLLRRYLKLTIEYCRRNDLLAVPLDSAGDLPFSLEAVPRSFPQPPLLALWRIPI